MADNTVISSDTILFNYEKVNHRLLFTTDLINIFELDSREYKAVLFYFKDTGYVFKHIYNVNEKDLFQVLVNEKNKYSLFKIPCSKLVRTYVGGESYYPYGGIKFLEIPAYYLFFPGQDYKTLYALKKQAIEKMFALTPELSRVEEYLNKMMQDRKFVDDSFFRLRTEKIFDWAEGQVQREDVEMNAEEFEKMLHEHQHEH